jgi:transposase
LLLLVCAAPTTCHHVIQFQCTGCGKWKEKRSSGSKLCWPCEKQKNEEDQPVDSPAATAPSPPPLYEHGEIAHTHLSTERRWAIIFLHKLQRDDAAIAKEVACDVRSVRYWISHYQQHGNVDDLHRSGRKRKTTSEQDEQIVSTAKRIKFTTPRRIKRKLGLDVSSRTIDRRLIEVGLFGRVAQHKKKYSAEHIRKRLSFAEGYKNWTAEQWMNVIFADEKIFWGEGFWGQVFVRRPKGEALNPDYCVDRDPHPEKVNVWGCFCGKGLGYCYIFNENMDGQLLKGVLGTHLIESAELHYDIEQAEQWWFLQDNAPQHKSVLVRTWLFNNGIQCIDFPHLLTRPQPDREPMGGSCDKSGEIPM